MILLSENAYKITGLLVIKFLGGHEAIPYEDSQ